MKDAEHASARSIGGAIDPSILDPRAGSTMYTDLADELRRLIESGSLAADSKLPAERALSAALGVSRVTVASAYRHLREAGWLRSKQGAGTFVAPMDQGRGWNSLVIQPEVGVVELVNAAPPASPFLAGAYADAVETLRSRRPDHGYVRMGVPRLRELVAERFCARGLPTTADQILITCGAGDATHAIFETFVDAGNRVLVEHPTYPGSVELIQNAGGRCVPVPLDPSDPDAFVANADRAARQSAPTLAYFVPDFSNPSGSRLPLAQRRTLAATMQRHGVVTVVDEVAVDLALDGSGSLEPFGAPVPQSATVTVGSLSKSVWGGLRVGWVRSDAAVTERIATTYLRRQLSVSVMDQLAAIELLERYDDVLADRRSMLTIGRDHLTALVRDRLPEWDFVLPDGGLSLWCSLPAGVSSSDLVASAQGRGLLLAPGPRFGTGYAFDGHQRLPFTRSLPELTAAVDILATVDIVSSAVVGGRQVTAVV